MSMKPSEETLTAWIDDALPPGERAHFEANLPAEAEEERRQAQELGQLLRSHLKAPPLRNADFFTQSILSQIQPPASGNPAKHATAAKPAASPTDWRQYLRLLWATAACATITLLLFAALSTPLTQNAGYYATFNDPKAGDNGISVAAFHHTKANITVLWLDGLDYVPESQKIVEGPTISHRGDRP